MELPRHSTIVCCEIGGAGQIACEEAAAIGLTLVKHQIHSVDVDESTYQAMLDRYRPDRVIVFADALRWTNTLYLTDYGEMVVRAAAAGVDVTVVARRAR